MMMDTGYVPMAPKQMHGADLKIEIISRIAIALKQGDIQSLTAFIQQITAIAQLKATQGTEMLNTDEMMDYSLRLYNLPPKFVYGGAQLAKIRQIINQQRAQQQQQQQAMATAKTAKDLGAANTGGDTNMLQKLIEQQSPGG
jgi:hypothetical protein